MSKKWGVILLLLVVAWGAIAAISYEKEKGTYKMTVAVDSGSTATFQQDTFYVGKCYGYKTVTGVAIIDGPFVTTDTAGSSGAYYGSLDSASLILKSKCEFGWYTLDSARRNAALPCTLRVAVPESSGDTLLMSDVVMIARLGDSAANRSDTMFYNVKYEFILK